MNDSRLLSREWITRFINCVELVPELWDCRHPGNKKRSTRDRHITSLAELIKEAIPGCEEAEKVAAWKWKNLRAAYVREYRRIQASLR